VSDLERAAPSGYDRYGPFSQYAPQPSPTPYYSGHSRNGPDVGQAVDIPAGWDAYAVLRRYRDAAAAAGARWAIDPNYNAEEAS